MFVVKEVLSRGFFRDKVLVIATTNASLSRKRLGWDWLQAPDVKTEYLRVSQGAEFVVTLPKDAATEWQQFNKQQVIEMRSFNSLWSSAAG
jgi:hypothetical protein